MTPDDGDQLEFWDEAVLPRPEPAPRAPSADERLREREAAIAAREAAVKRLEGETGQALIRVRLEAEHERRLMYASADADAARIVRTA